MKVCSNTSVSKVVVVASLWRLFRKHNKNREWVGRISRNLKDVEQHVFHLVTKFKIVVIEQQKMGAIKPVTNFSF